MRERFPRPNSKQAAGATSAPRVCRFRSQNRGQSTLLSRPQIPVWVRRFLSAGLRLAHRSRSFVARRWRARDWMSARTMAVTFRAVAATLAPDEKFKESRDTVPTKSVAGPPRRGAPWFWFRGDPTKLANLGREHTARSKISRRLPNWGDEGPGFGVVSVLGMPQPMLKPRGCRTSQQPQVPDPDVNFSFPEVATRTPSKTSRQGLACANRCLRHSFMSQS